MMKRRDDGWWEVSGMDPISPCSPLTAYLVVFRDHTNPKLREEAYWKIADMLWNSDALPEKLYVRHKWAEKMIREAIREKYLAIGGAASSGKSHIYAGWGIINWLAAPDRTLVLMTSTTLSGARQRIWGSFIRLISVLDNIPLRLRDSIGAASYEAPDGTVMDTAGFHLVAAEKSKTKDAVAKFIGRKQARVILIADELADISEAIIQAGLSNLASNPFFQLIGLSNPSSRFDAFGVWAEPSGGWDSIMHERDYEWRTKSGGKYLRFDAEQSPNIEAGEDLYPWLPTKARVEEAKSVLGDKSRGYFRMYRAVFFDSDESTGVFSEADLNRNGAMLATPLKDVIRVAGFDPAFTNGGDRAILCIAEVGYDEIGQFCLRFTDHIPIFEDQTNKAVPRTYQIAQQVIDLLKKHKVPASNLAVDSTGAGNPFCDVLAGELGGSDFMRVQFGGRASTMRVSVNNRLTGSDLYANRVTELWFAGRELLRCRQIRGVTAELARELVGREYEMRAGGERIKMKLESKSDFKAKIGMSPDLADASFLAIDAARQRVGLWAAEPPERDPENANAFRRYRTFRDLDVAAKSTHAQLE